VIVRPNTLIGEHITLQPLSQDDEAALIHVVKDGDLWDSKHTLVPSPEHVRPYIQRALRAMEEDKEYTFAIWHHEAQKIVGSTKLRNIDPKNSCLEVAASFIAKSFQGTYVNSEAKLLLLEQAFEVWDLKRVKFVTDSGNTASQKALERLGAIKETILHEQEHMPDWNERDSIVYSILSSHWDACKKRLLVKSP